MHVFNEFIKDICIEKLLDTNRWTQKRTRPLPALILPTDTTLNAQNT